MCTLEKEKKNFKSVILIIVIVILLAVIGVLAYMVLHPKVQEPAPVAETQSEPEEPDALGYDSAVVAMDEDSLAKAVKEMLAEDGTMALEMQVVADSTNGLDFTCDLANSPRNKYDMYMTIYLDETGEEIYRSGLIPLGKRIDKFTVNKQLSAGSHECTLVYTQVEDDHATTHASVNVGLTLNVR
jgi:hypothetical protein